MNLASEWLPEEYNMRLEILDKRYDCRADWLEPMLDDFSQAFVDDWVMAMFERGE